MTVGNDRSVRAVYSAEFGELVGSGNVEKGGFWNLRVFLHVDTRIGFPITVTRIYIASIGLSFLAPLSRVMGWGNKRRVASPTGSVSQSSGLRTRS